MRAESCFPHFSRLGHPCPRAGRSARNFWTACVVATVPLRRAVRHQLVTPPSAGAAAAALDDDLMLCPCEGQPINPTTSPDRKNGAIGDGGPVLRRVVCCGNGDSEDRAMAVHATGLVRRRKSLDAQGSDLVLCDLCQSIPTGTGKTEEHPAPEQSIENDVMTPLKQVSVVVEHRRKDFAEMIAHHLATLALIYISFQGDEMRVGCAIMEGSTSRLIDSTTIGPLPPAAAAAAAAAAVAAF
eukprot:scaffold462_cov195-Pinguiococcus_pyrenoidosus.AAC.24